MPWVRRSHLIKALGEVDWLDEYEYSCLAVQGQSLDPENKYIKGPFWLWVHFVAPIFVITVDGQNG